jgi:hypothetical protein
MLTEKRNSNSSHYRLGGSKTLTQSKNISNRSVSIVHTNLNNKKEKT